MVSLRLKARGKARVRARNDREGSSCFYKRPEFTPKIFRDTTMPAKQSYDPNIGKISSLRRS
jgi:hypothetical protein